MNTMTFGRRWPLCEEADPNKGGGGGGEGEKKTDAGAGGEDGLGTVEDRAKRMGWTPKEQFRGDQAKWVDAQTFVKNGEESLPILRERMRTLERANSDLSKTAAEFKKMSDSSFERAYARAKRELEERIDAGAEAGGEAGKKVVKAATKELGELEREKAERDAAASADPVFDGWVEQNNWYQDPELKVEAEAIAFKLRRKNDKTDGVAFLEKVKEEMKKQFPEKFGNPRRQAAAGAERPSGGGDGGGGSGAAKGWDKLPAEAKEAGDRYIKQKLYPDRAAYAKAYFEQN